MGSGPAANRVPCSSTGESRAAGQGPGQPGKGVAVREGFLEEVASEPWSEAGTGADQVKGAEKGVSGRGTT